MNKHGFGAVGIISVVAVLLAVGGLVFLSTPPASETEVDVVATQPTPNDSNPSGTRLNEAEGGPIEDDWTDTPQDGVEPVELMDGGDMDSTDAEMEMESDVVLASAPGSFSDYTEDKLKLAEEGDVVLFFAASWCPSCRAAESDINENVASIPENTHILKVDYDTATALRQQHGVTTQHTYVQVDASGNQIQKWTGGNTLDSIVARL